MLSGAALPQSIQTPAVLVDLDIVERNIAEMAAAMAARGVRLRPHVKTHKSVSLARMQLDAGAAGITVGTVGEAEVMAAAGIDDIFVAYPVWAAGERGRRVRALHEKARLRVGIDSAEGARLLGDAVRGPGQPLEVLIEIDSGGRRTGASSPESALAVAQAARSAGLEVIGLFTHGGHAYQAPDTAAGAAGDERTSLARVAGYLRDSGFEIVELSAGSTPTALLSAAGEVTEQRPGTYVFGDRQQVALGSCRPESVALVVAATVISRQVPGQVVLDAGAKSLARERAPYLAGIAAVPQLGDAVIDRAYDYHGIVELANGQPVPGLGRVVAVLPNHVCPVVNLADEILVIRDGSKVERWPVDARGRNG